MLDISYFQSNDSNVQGFFSGGTWQTWIKPKGAKLVNIICVGSGAGGGGGSQDATTPRGGGGGGGGATARLTINANLLPDILYVLPGIGGDGGLGGTITTAASGSLSQNSFVTLIPDTTSISGILIRSGTTRAIGGGGGTTVGGLAGAGETINVIANNIFANLGNFTFGGGPIGALGGTTTGGTGATTNYNTGATGGGGVSSGGSTAGIGVFPAQTGAAVTQNGRNGFILYKPTLMLFGGFGGGGSGAANGGNGGNGAPGTGGGGGGGGVTLSGNGGRGGNGFVIITTSI